MSTRRWLILGSHIPPEGGLGGMIRYTVELTRALHARADTDVHITCRPETVAVLADDLGIPRSNIHDRASGSVLADSLAERLTVDRLASRIGADVVLGSKQLLPRSSGGAVRVLTIHDMLPFDRPAEFGWLKRLLLPAVYRRSIDEADLLACVSSASRQRLLHHVPDAEARAVVVRNAMTSRLIDVEPEPIAELVGRRFALMVGDRSPRKNAGFVLGLWAEVSARVAGATLAMVGPPGWGRDQELPELAGLVDGGAVAELGRVSDGALRWAYEHATVTLCPSLLEGFGLPVLEALTLRCPTIVSTDPAQVEAAAGSATVVDVADRTGWIEAIVGAFDGGIARPTPPPTRTWDDLARELVALTAGPTTEQSTVRLWATQSDPETMAVADE